ncbi:thioredoxin [Flexilinea flocculi]|jgi:thioredoxin 1|uniref:Thioredoxin n=1 Tax=Flexilinea flocculi TaxID=1678840 RepID=A0A0S7BVU9_9CHLR|nr:thioredoxin [Flexilinea flocculi]NMB93616.1 thioredoxin [Flexilinea flocculi]GAP41633.1 thioredoxin [Flexilinea flocculi]
MNSVIHVNDDQFEEVVLKAELPVLVDFWAPWCGPCRMVAPLLDKIASEYSGKIIVAKVNTDENSQWAVNYRVQGIPTMLFISKGQVVKTQVGALSESGLKNLVNDFLAGKN